MLTDFLYVDKTVSTIVYSNGTEETTADVINSEFKKYIGAVLDFGNFCINKDEVFTIKSSGFGVGNRITVYFKNGKMVSFIPASAPAVIFNILNKYKKIDAPTEVSVVDAPVKEVEAIPVKAETKEVEPVAEVVEPVVDAVAEVVETEVEPVAEVVETEVEPVEELLERFDEVKDEVETEEKPVEKKPKKNRRR